MCEGLNSQTLCDPPEDTMLKKKKSFFWKSVAPCEMTMPRVFFCHFNLSHKCVFQTPSVSQK